MSDTLTPNPLLEGTKYKSDLNYVQNLFDRAKKSRQQFERQWYMNLAFFRGKQYVQWTPSVASNSRLWEPPVPKWRARLISNKIRPITRAELSKVTKEKPQAFVVPASTDDSDLAAAMAAEKVFEYEWRVLMMDRVVRRTMFWTLLCGVGFIKDWYETTTTDITGEKGRIFATPVSPWHFYIPDSSQEELDDQEFVIHSSTVGRDYVYNAYKRQVTTGSSGNTEEQEYLSAVGITSQGQKKDTVTLKEAWIKPCKQWKDGALITWADDEILQIEEKFSIYNHGEFPFTKFEHIPSGTFYSDSTITDLIPLQKEYNRTRSQIIESKNRMAKPQLVAARGSVDPNKITSEPGLIIFYTPGYQPPTPLPLQNLPSYVLQELDRCQSDMDDISSQHEITKGQTPPGVTAATAISYLQEQDDSKLAPTISSLEEGVERIGRHFLSHVNQFWDMKRKVQVIGTDGQYEALELSRADLKGNTDLKVEAGSAMPRSRAAKQAFILELSDKGLIPPDKTLRYLDMAETGRLYEEMQIDSRQAQRENMRMIQGIGPDDNPLQQAYPVNDWDNHDVHITEHNNFRKRQEFETSPDEIKQIFQQHVDTHKQLLMQSMGQMIKPGEQLPQETGQQPGQDGGQPPTMGSQQIPQIPPTPGT